MKFLRFLVCSVLAVALLPLPVFAKNVQGKTSAKLHHAAKKAVIQKSRAPVKAIKKHKHLASNDGAFEEVAYTGGELKLASSKALVVNQNTGETLFAKSTNTLTPIASVTKLMTAMVLLDQHLPMEESVTVSDADVDMLKGSSSRLRVGSTLSRHELLQLALMASENRAAAALARTSEHGTASFVAAMNAKAAEIGMKNSWFTDPTGLNSENVSTAEDLVKMVRAAYQYPEIRNITTTPDYNVSVAGYRQPLEFHNTNALVRTGKWEIGLSKTGYINEAGRCLVMQAQIADQPLIIVLLDSWGKLTRIGDAQRIRKWVESTGNSSHSRLSAQADKNYRSMPG